MKHRSRVEREENEEADKKRIRQAMARDSLRMNELQRSIDKIEKKTGRNGDDSDDDLEDVDGMKAEVKELEDSNKKHQEKLDEYERNKKWNVDNMCTVVDEKVRGGRGAKAWAKRQLVLHSFTSFSPSLRSQPLASLRSAPRPSRRLTSTRMQSSPPSTRVVMPCLPRRTARTTTSPKSRRSRGRRRTLAPPQARTPRPLPPRQRAMPLRPHPNHQQPEQDPQHQNPQQMDPPPHRRARRPC